MKDYSFHNINELLAIAKKEDLTIAQIAIRNAAFKYSKSEVEIIADMRERLKVNKESIEFGIENEKRTLSGLAGGEAKKLMKMNKSILGSSLHDAIAFSFAITEANVFNRKIVAFPTAGSSGVVPATLIAYANNNDISEEILIESYFVAGAIGIAIAENSFLSGAAGGCQAEIGSATAMAAAGLGYMAGLDIQGIVDAAAIALKGMLGLVCDPIAGLVECPCVKRNAIGVGNAFTAVEIVLAGVVSNIPLDQVIDAMREIGISMNEKYKETGEGGIATTKTGRMIWKRLFGKKIE